MRKAFIFSLFLLLPAIVCAQGIRWDLGTPGSAGAVTTTGGGLSTLVSLPGVHLNWCSHPANAVPCTNYATTYTSLTLGTPCASTTQVVLQGSNTCVATGDNFGNLGVYTANNTVCTITCYDYTLTVNGVSYGPFVYTAGSINGVGITGTCATSNAIPVMATSTSIGCSAATDDGTNLTYTGTNIIFSSFAGGVIQTTNGLLQLLGASSSSGDAPELDVTAGTSSFGGGKGGNLVIQAGRGATPSLTSNGRVSISTSSTAFYLSGINFASLATPRGNPSSTLGAMVLCTDCKGPQDGIGAGSVAAGSGTGSALFYDTTHWRVLGGLGTTNPNVFSANSQTYTNNPSYNGLVTNYYAGNGSGSANGYSVGFIGYRGQNTVASGTFPLSGDQLSIFGGAGCLTSPNCGPNTGFSTPQSGLLMSAGQNWTAAHAGTFSEIFNTPLSSLTPAVSVLFDNAGNVEIGTPAPTAAGLPSGVLYSKFDTSGNETVPTLTLTDPGPFGSTEFHGTSACETSYAPTSVNTGSVTTTTGQTCIPANAYIDAVVYRVTTAITTAVSFVVGVSGTTSKFCTTQSTLTLGATGVCTLQINAGAAIAGASAVAAVVTFNANPGAGALRLIVYYHTWTAPAS